MAKKKKEETIVEEAGLPDNWQPVDVAPIRPGSPSGAPPPPNAMNNYFQGSSSQLLQHDTNYLKSDYGTPGIPNNLLIPIGISGSPAANSAIKNANRSSFVPAPTPTPIPTISVQLFQVNGNPDLLSVGAINGIPA